MLKYVIFLFLISSTSFSQDYFIGKHETSVLENGILKKKTILNPQPNPEFKNIHKNTGDVTSNQQQNAPAASTIRWNFNDPAAIGDFSLVSGNGKYCVTSWNLNSKRISFYNSQSGNLLWEYTTDPLGYLNFISISDTGGVIALGSYHNVMLFNNSSNTPFFNFDLTQLADTGIATFVDISKNGQFLVCCASRNDSSTIFGFNSSSTVPLWKTRLHPTVTTGGGSIQGIKMSGNDSLLIVNTYAEFYVMNAFTGQIIYNGLINPSTPSNGTQAIQGISGDGSIIATINYTGNLRVYQRSGSTYTFLWQNTEPPGTYYNWYTCVDITYDGSYISAGTLNFITSSSYDGKVKVFKRTGSGVPEWTYTGCGDEVTGLSFSKSGNILAASSWGDFNGMTDDLYIFKTFLGGVPIYKLSTSGSLFYCNTSNDGRTVISSGKAVHARQFGSGGLVYNIDVDTSEVPTSISGNTGIISDYVLNQNYPNPFNPSTKISYAIPKEGFVTLKIYDVLGKEVMTLVNETKQAGYYEVEFSSESAAGRLASGIYFYKLETGSFKETKLMIMIK
ncbi:MAG: hypothetical protein HGGPFJEG_03094 [Ignavibacteria bacterium]|nr:hypothetical protein [Ignavibacteria bacterium]